MKIKKLPPYRSYRGKVDLPETEYSTIYRLFVDDLKVLLDKKVLFELALRGYFESNEIVYIYALKYTGADSIKLTEIFENDLNISVHFQIVSKDWISERA